MNFITAYPASFVFYLSILLLTLLFSYIASKSGKVTARIFISLTIFILTLVAGFRGITVGIDTKNYLEVIENIESMIGTRRIKPTELGYAFYVIIIKFFTNNPQVVLIVSAFITNALIVIRLWSFRKQASFTFSVFLYTSMYFVLTLNTMRQWIAIAIIFFAIKYLFEQRYIKFSVFVLVASTFHTTALITLLLIPIFLFYKRKDSLKSKKQFLMSLIASPFVIVFSILVIRTTSTISQYEHYFRDPELDFSLSWFIRVIIVLFIIVFIKQKSSMENDTDYLELKRNSFEVYKIIKVVAVVGLILRSIGLFYEYTARVGLYYSIAEIILFSMVIKTKKIGLILRIVISILALVTFYLAMKGSGYGQMPYIPFWKN